MIRWNNFGEIKEFATHSDIPVINGMSDINHPVQALADVFTMMEKFGTLKKLKVGGDEAVGVDIIRKAVEEPIRWIAINAGRDGSVVVDAVKKSKVGVGYDAEADDFGNMVEKGIIDPTKVVRSALQNATSIAIMVLITESLVTDIPEKEKMPPMPAGGGMEGMY